MDPLERKIPTTNVTHTLCVSLFGPSFPALERADGYIDRPRPRAMMSACSEIFITSARAGKRDYRTGPNVRRVERVSERNWTF
jgi:hypothetical protein